MNLFGWFNKSKQNPIVRQRARSERVGQYARYLRSYQGFSIRGNLNSNLVSEWKRLKFNYSQPIVNLGAGWFAAKPLDWSVDGNPDATAEAYKIWDRSGSDNALLEAALLCSIYGDSLGLATQDSDGKAKIEFVDPSICEPQFQGADSSTLSTVEIAFETRNSQGDPITHREMYAPEGVEIFEDDLLIERRTYDKLPCAWIRNQAIKGLPFGISDIEPIVELVEELDHLASKQSRVIDYYSAPNIIFSGVQKSSTQAEKSVGTVFYLPENGRASFLEWSGSGPDIEAQLTRIRNAIAEISQVPAVAFGQADSGLTSISGVALKILYGPLINKTHRKQASWGPSLEYLMWLALQASGFDVALEAVNVKFPDATPVDGQAAISEASGKIAARLSSRKTEMNNLGIEDPDSELKRIIIEEKMLQLTTGGQDLMFDANRAASLGAHGRFVSENPGEAGRVADITSTSDEDIAHLMDRFDALANETSQEY